MNDAARRAGRPETDVVLNAVTKAATLDAIREAVDAGARVLGENRIQVAAPKIEQAEDLAGRVAWHMIGHLQRNKARRAVDLFERIEGVDRMSLARRLSDLGQERGAAVRILAEINVSGEESKGGFPRAEAAERVAEIRELPGVRLEGLMTMAPFTDDESVIRECFRGLREIRDGVPAAEGFTELSMGMTNDFEIAVEEGATMVRVGSAIFG